MLYLQIKIMSRFILKSFNIFVYQPFKIYTIWLLFASVQSECLLNKKSVDIILIQT